MTTAAEGCALAPKLRFPGFRDEWEWTALGECLDYQQPTDYLVSATNYSDSYTVPVLTAGKTFILGYTNETNGVFSEGLPVIIFDDFTTATQFVDFPFKAKSSAMKILLARGEANIKFMYELMQMIAYEVGTHERHWISKFAPMLVLIPKTEEQQKIADCLASIDELITLESQKLDHLKLYKKGLMQQLFLTEGETVPRLRFPEFRNTGEWLKRKLGSLGSFTGGGTPDKNNFSYWEGMNPWVSSSDISDDSIYEIKISRFISDQAIQETVTKIVPENSILLVSRVGVGKIAITRNKICTSQDFTNFTPDEANLVFLAYGLKTMRDKFLSFNQGMAIKGFTKNDVSSLEVPLPVEPREQQKIADCLASIDELITLESQRLDNLKTHKKGLVQQLFPAPDGFSAAQAGKT